MFELRHVTIPTILTVLILTGCDAGSTLTGPPQAPVPVRNRATEQLAKSIARGLAAACPLGADPADERARDDCAGKLTELGALRDTMREPFIWGGQAADASYRLDSNTSKFNARVWRRMYLSTFMFGSSFRIEQVGTSTVLHMPVTFRYALPIGAFPYPFWHSDKKWNSYSYATTIHFILEDGQVIGALRSSEQDVTRPKVPHSWNGLWTWNQGGAQMPYVSLYKYLLSRNNPLEARLNKAYRALEAQMRQYSCPVCHAPDNLGNAPQLEFFVYPNQALAGRHDIVTQLLKNAMPPPANMLGVPAGIADAEERALLLQLAREFEAAGDQALAWERDNKIQLHPLHR